MLIKNTSQYYLKRTRASSKEIEFNVSVDLKAAPEKNIIDLFPLTIALIADFCIKFIHNIINTDNKDIYINELYFSSKFFDSFLNLDESIGNKTYILLIGSVSYYLCNQTGSSIVLAKKINKKDLNLSDSQIEQLIFQMLTNDEEPLKLSESNQFDKEVYFISKKYNEMLKQGKGIDINFLNDFRRQIYTSGSDRDLLFMDIMYTLFLLKQEYSLINLLPQYSPLTKQDLIPIINKNHFVKELWPSQREMCKKGMFNYNSGVVQLPTGAGKTKAISLAVYSMFKIFTSGLSIIVLPFRALCREVCNDLITDLSFDSAIHINALSDLIQSDYSIEKLFKPTWKSVIVTTPEKLSYVLKHNETIVSDIKQIIFDEGHLFDDNTRGAKYELLLTEILNKIDFDVQNIFISAIIPNVEDVNRWLTKDQGFAIKGKDISSVEKLPSIIEEYNEFFSLSYLNKEDFDKEEYYIPKLFERKTLKKIGKERKDRFFPEKQDKNDIAIACLLKTIKNATSALFCGRKDSTDKILDRIIDISKREYDISDFYKLSDANEVRCISNLIKDNYGDSNNYYIGSTLGVFVHHGGISDGIRSAIEYSLRKNLINNVICTSTLAQGVNLPIKYLIVSNLYQSDELMKVRDFQNLIGRTGRPGIYTEGTIILADSRIRKDDYKWKQYKRLLNQNNSEKCNSKILELVSDISIVDRKHNFTENIIEYYKDRKAVVDELNMIHKESSNQVMVKFFNTFMRIIQTLGDLENYIATVLLDEADHNNLEELILCNSLAYSMANEEEKQSLFKIIKVIIEFVQEKFEDSVNKKAYVNSMLSIEVFSKIENYVHNKIEITETCDEIFQDAMEMVYCYSDNKCIKNVMETNQVSFIAKLWIKGFNYNYIFEQIIHEGFQLKCGNHCRDYRLLDVINICDSGFGYAASIIINCMREIIINTYKNSDSTIEILEELSKKLKYGLPTQTDIYVYELGFNDRVIAQLIHNIIGECQSLGETKKKLSKYYESLYDMISDYPIIYQDKIKSYHICQ